jgi:hypothetical protein
MVYGRKDIAGLRLRASLGLRRLSRRELFSRMQLIRVIDPVTDEAYKLVEAQNHRDQKDDSPHGHPWHVSFHASQFPGDDPMACPRAALYQLADFPAPEPFNRNARTVMAAGKAIEVELVSTWADAGILLSAHPDEPVQTGFELSDAWLTGSTDAVILRPRTNWPTPVEIKSKYQADIDLMRVGAKGPDDKHVSQIKTQISFVRLAQERGEIWTGLDLCDHGYIYYLSRDKPSVTAEFRIDHDPTFFEAGLARLKEWKGLFLEDVLPELKPPKKVTTRSHPNGWRWSYQPCQWCLDPATRVLTTDLEWVPIGELNEGDELVGFDEDRGQKYRTHYGPSTVERFTRFEAPERLRIYTDFGKPVVCTPDHQWLCVRDHYRKWLRADELRDGDYICTLGKPWETDESREAGWLAGFFDGEGTLQRAHVTVAQRPGAVLEAAKSALDERGFHYSEQEHVSGVGSLGRNDCVRLRINGGIAERLRLLGSIRPLRFLERAEEAWVGHPTWSNTTVNALVTKVEQIGPGEVIGIETSTKTFVAEGMLSHNCNFKKTCQLDHREGVHTLSESVGIERAKLVRPHYDFDEAVQRVKDRWETPVDRVLSGPVGDTIPSQPQTKN